MPDYSGLPTDWNNSVIFNTTGADQTWSVPAGITYILAKIWGAGGASGYLQNGDPGWQYAWNGGAGGFGRGIIPVTPAETLTIKVGGRGVRNPGTTRAYGGGGAHDTTGDNIYGGGGGGYSGIFRSTTPLLIAGGGGGGGLSYRYPWDDSGGAGGGTTGQAGRCLFGYGFGQGGTQSAGGAQGGNGNGGSGNAGAAYLGGNVATNSYGGAGGGGYYGGGSGSYYYNQWKANDHQMGGGGGGSGYVGNTVIFASITAGNYAEIIWPEDPDLPSGNIRTRNIAYGGLAGNSDGGYGYIKIFYST